MVSKNRKNMTCRNINALVCLLLIILSTSTLRAEGPRAADHNLKPWPVSRYSVRAGGFWAINTTDIGIGTVKNPYSILDFENDLGMNRHTGSILLNANMRLGRHHRFDLSYYYINRNSKATLNKEINFGDHTYPVDAEVDVFLNTNIFRFSYGFAFISNSCIEAGALIGAHIMRFGVGMDAVGNSAALSLSDRSHFTAPLPDCGIWTTWAFHRNWALSGEFSYFGITIGDIHGRLLNGSLTLQRRLGNHWGLELGYTLFNVKVTVDRPRLQGDLKWKYNGPTITAAYRFGHNRR